MKLTAFSLTLSLAVISCSKTDLQRGVESFSSSSFARFENRINGIDLLLTADESLIIAGNAISDQGTKMVELSNGDLVVMGNSNEGNSSNSHYDLFLLKTDSEGVPK